jgi:ankyrin repeat protein
MKKVMALVAFSGMTCVITPAQNQNSRIYDSIRNGDTGGLRKLLTDSGPDTKDSRGTTPLMYAAALGNPDTMKALIDAGADVNAKNDFDITALMWCATEEAKVRLLLGKGADVNARSKQGITPLLIAAGTDGNSGVVKMLLDKGADLDKADMNPGTTPLVAAATANDTAMVRLLLEHGAKFAGPPGGAALIRVAGAGNTEVMGMLLSRGVPANVSSPPSSGPRVKNGDIAIGLLTPLIAAVSYGGLDATKMLLDRKANVNAQDVRGMTPLMLALALDHPDPRIVRLLLEHGADPNIKSKSGETALDWARKFNNPDILKTLDLAPVTANVSFNQSVAKPAEAVQKSVNLLQRTAGSFFVNGGCSACHAQNLISMALTVAGTAGIQVDAAAAKDRALQTRTFWSPQEQTLMIRMDAPGGHNMTSYGLLQFQAEGVNANSTTDAMVHNVAAQQQANGSWHNDTIARPPMADGDFTHTAIAIRSLAAYGTPARKMEFAARIARGANWLRAAKPSTSEDYNMQLLGLKWAGVSGDIAARLAIGAAGRQRSDGGWAQTPYLTSDAYATGQTLAALKEAGVPVSDPAYRRGAEFLLKTQLADGSWHVASRSPKFQPYFQSGFPHDHDQWISMSATAWATMALAYTLPDVNKAGPALAVNRLP